MATTTTAAAVPILRDRAVLTTDVVALAFKIIRMTSGTIRLEGRVAPVDGLGVVLVARRTQQVAAVIQWLVQQTRVHIGMRDPGHGVVTLIALPW
jgi:hypothetical protein